MDCAFEPIARATDIVVGASIRHLGYIFCYRRNVEKLKRDTEDLERDKERVEHQVDDAKRNVEEIEADVNHWLETATKKIKESKEFQDDKAHSNTACSMGILPFLWYRHRRGRKAKKMAKDIKLQREKSKFERISYRQPPNSANTTLSNVGYVEFESRKNAMEKIMEQLGDSSVRMIGVHGPSGVGKTTLVKDIAKKAKEKKLFDEVVMVSVTKDPNRQKIQEEIADYLGLTFEGEGENRRADRLRERLKQEKANILVILDDLWDELDLNKLGIPFDGDDDLGHVTAKGRKDSGYETVKNEDSSGVCKGCKILLTSITKNVLYDKMNVKENSIFHVAELDDEEALALLKKVAEISDENSKFKPEVVKKYCAGLPMVILLVGRALRNKSESVWEDELEELKKQGLLGVQKSMENYVKMNFGHLESEELKSIFLVCAQMGHQPLIVDLVKYCFGLGILKGVHTLRDARDRISKSIQMLKDSNLILSCDSSDHFDMHDLVRDAALSIAQEEQNVFILRNDKLDDWPDKEELERCTAISIYKGDIVDELPEVINCPQLRVFHIDSDDTTLKLPDKFFERMEKLRVLMLIGIDLSSLPSSIERLSNLRMLCLERCTLGNLSIIGDLQKLRILSLSGSKIEDWPAELGGLSKLQLLDITYCSISNLIPPNFISSLTSLEELYVRNSLIKIKEEEETNQSQISILSELKHLHELKILDVCIPGAELLPVDVFFDKLSDYRIVIGDFKTLSVGVFKMPSKYEVSRSLAVKLKPGADIHSLKGVKMLFKRVENLLLGELNGVQNAFYELNLDGFPDLKHLSIIDNNVIEHIVNSMELSQPQDAFPILESLNLINLMNVKKICCSPVTDASFSRLKTVKVEMCPELKNLFYFYVVKFLTSLETIDVSECDYLEAIVVEEGEASNKVELHKLCSLTLQKLPSFTSFYTNKKMHSIPQFMDRQATITAYPEIVPVEGERRATTSLSLFDEKVEIPNLESLKLFSINIHRIWSDQLSSSCFENLMKLSLNDCGNLTYLCSLSVASNLKKLKGLFISECQLMEKLFNTEGNSSDYSAVCIFPKLEVIKLTDMETLKDIWPVEVSADSFPSLISVAIDGCRKLEKIFPCHTECWYLSLECLTVYSCDSVEFIFEIRCPPQQDALGADTKLQIISFMASPKSEASVE